MGAQEQLVAEVEEVREKYQVVGRREELRRILAAARAGRHILLEGPVGVGKTFLAKVVASHLGREFVRVDGDERLTESKLIGYWDPPIVLSKGYVREAFIEGPLTKAALSGSILFINELNRLPESAQNALLPVMDEGLIIVPHLGELRAKPGFLIIATQNPEESVGVTRLSEALRDRFVLIKLDYQSEEEEREIVRLRSGVNDPEVVSTAVRIVRETRVAPSIRRGASVRSAIDLASVVSQMSSSPSEDDWVTAAVMVLSTRVELREGL
ncbi:MAG TPA: MoxR family ATPase, partial [Candidatus Korarchaeota archaeon]|nr:MoxR family ATPase [Candidatus Korarchaeota archaeon]